MDFQGQILNTLLDKYETSQHYQGEAIINRKVRFPFKEKNIPEYWHTDKPHWKLAIHQIVAGLAERGIITINWLPFEKGNLLDSVVLNLEKVDEVYLLVNRIPKRDTVENLNKRLKDLQRKTTIPWIKEFLNVVEEESRKNKGIPSLIPQEEDERELLFQVFLGLEELGGSQILERVFSTKYLGNSKIFQRKLRKRLAGIARQFAFENRDMDDDDIILELGIEKTTEELLLKGDIVFEYEEQVIDYGIFPFGGIIDTNFARQLKIIETNAKVILTVENKSNFHYLASRELPRDVLLIYTGGFPGPRKRELLGRLYSFALERQFPIAYFHWGDIDIGGFRIFKVLQGVFPTLVPLFMEIDTVKKFRQYCEETNQPYNAQLKKLLSDETYVEFHDVIGYLYQNKVRLEQEALLISDELISDLLGVILERTAS